jgi:ribosomal protein L27
MGADFTLMAEAEGKVVFQSGRVHIVPSDPNMPRYSYVS